MGRRDDFRKTMQHQRPDRLIIDLGGNPLSGMDPACEKHLLQHLGYTLAHTPDILPFGRLQRLDERLLCHFGTDTRSIGYIFCPQESVARRVAADEAIDEWGIRRKLMGPYWEIIEHPLKGATVHDLKHYPWPDPSSIDQAEIDACSREARRIHDETDYILCAEHPVYGIFELGCWMCGFDDFLMRMLDDQEFVDRFFSIILDYQLQVIKRYYQAVGPYIDYTSSGDDFATQNGMFMSPDLFRQQILPYFAERVRQTKALTGAAFLHHSCGSVYPIIGDLAAAGVDLLNPIQPGARDMEPEKLKAAHGQQIVFHGGFDTQRELPFGSRESITAAVDQLVQTMDYGSGFVFAAAHNIQNDVPAENIVAMFEAARRY